ncbi:hypothetical protein ACIBQX_19510 [Nonomuraea sp. NPDC049714]|uniref:hypothetical protein n=1 Tax=Nonomuraea sp. NPDC049714 TaxID=3364357 RepID=UPI0037A8A2CE
MAAGLRITGIVLLGTTNSRGAHSATFAACAAEIKAGLTSDDGLCGARFPSSTVSVVEVAGPTIHDTSAALCDWLDQNPASELLVTCGSGAFSLSVGAVCAALETHHPVRIFHIDAPTEPHTLNQPADPDSHLKSWLLRHRFWDALSDVDPAGAPLWQILAARQAADPGLMKHLSAGQPEWSGSAGTWATVQAAVSERFGRGEAADYGLLRAWYGEQLRRFFEVEQEKLAPHVRNEIERLIDTLRTRAEDGGGMSAYIRQISRSIDEDLDSACVRMIRDSALAKLYTEAATHRAHLKPEQLHPGPLPPTLLSAIERWENGDRANRLIADTGQTAWPVVGSGDVLALVGVGLDREGVEVEDRHTTEVILTELWKRRERFLRRGMARIRLLASPESLNRARRIAREITMTYAGVDVRVVEGVQGGVDHVRDTVIDALRAEAQPTGRTGSGSLRDVDEIVLFLNPGPPLTNYGMIAAGVAWSLTAACPLSMMELTRIGSSTQVRGGRPVLARLGADRMLAQLAVSAVKHLDLRTARRLLERGSAQLHSVLPALESLEANLYGACPRIPRGPDEFALARQRLLLIAHVHGDQPDLAAYLAVTALRPALFSWSGWEEIREPRPAIDKLSLWANRSAHGHGLDRRWRAPRRRGGGGDVYELLLQAVRELKGPSKTDTELIMKYKSVTKALEFIFQEGG